MVDKSLVELCGYVEFWPAFEVSPVSALRVWYLQGVEGLGTMTILHCKG
jgi:hypothetical protein